MRGAVLYGPRDVRFEERETPKIVKPTDAIIRISATCVCGSDLWPYRGGRRAKRLAYAPVRSNLDRDGGHRLDSAVGRTDRGNSKRRCHLDSGGGEALARRDTKYSDDPHRNTGRAQWQSCGMDGAGDRRAIPQVITVHLNGRRSR